MTEYWIWNNQQRGWCGRFDNEYTNLLHEAGRYNEGIVAMVVAKFNEGQTGDQWPNVVAIPVTNDYLFAAGRAVLEEFDAQNQTFNEERFRREVSRRFGNETPADSMSFKENDRYRYGQG